MLRFSAPLQRALAIEFDRLLEIALREINPLLVARGARADAVTLRELFAALRGEMRLGDVLRRLFVQIDKENLRALGRQLPEVPISAVLPNGGQLQQQFIRANTQLIQVERRVQQAVEKTLQQPIDAGVRVEEIREQLRENFGFEKKRAQLIARDQTLKASGQVQEARQRAAGIARYVWTTSADERVRDDHDRLEGLVFSWDDPPIVNQSEVDRGRPARREHPGGDFQCRCNADPVIDDEPEESEQDE